MGLSADSKEANVHPTVQGTKAGKLQVVDFARGFAIFTIVLMHLSIVLKLPGLLKNAVALGGAGVHVFILCSGFGLYLSHLKRPLDYATFIRRRASRCYLPYLVAVLLWVAFGIAVSHKVDWQAVASHVLLYKMFNAKLDVSLCYYYWFISTIIQFYICWPIMLKLAQMRRGVAIAFAISLSWAALVGVLGLSESRPWGSCFLQYMWEFCLGMWLATKADLIEGQIAKLRCLTVALVAVICLAVSGAMGFLGGVLKLFNDIPSSFGYLACVLLVYKAGIRPVNRFFEFTSGFGYEWYLLHGLAFAVLSKIFPSLPPVLNMAVCAFGVNLILKKFRPQTGGGRPT